jgi:hypothetical protein
MLSEFLFYGQLWKIVNNESYEVDSGVHCDNYQIIGDSEQDLAIIKVSPNARTPRQLVKYGEKTIEVFLEGSGKLFVENERGEVVEHHFSKGQDGNFVLISIGDKMQWIAGENGLLFAEICKPPYREGRFINIDNE